MVFGGYIDIVGLLISSSGEEVSTNALQIKSINSSFPSTLLNLEKVEEVRYELIKMWLITIFNTFFVIDLKFNEKILKQFPQYQL